MGQLAQIILDNLYKLWPLRSIDADCQGVRFTGKHVALLPPGFHWFIPGLQRIEELAVAYQEIDCAIQTVETTDGISVSFSANCGYTVEDAAARRTKVHDFDSTLERMIRGHFADAVAENSYAGLMLKRKQLARSVKTELKKETSLWGVTIVRVRLTDFTRARPWRVFGLGAVGNN